MKKVLVIGCPGSGKSTFSRALPLSSIHIHFGVEPLVLTTPLTSAVCQKA